MKKLLLTSCLALGIASGLFADSINATASIGGAAAGVTKLNLNGAGVGAVTQANGGGITFSSTGSAQLVTGSLGGIYAAPYFSGLNGAGFGDAPGAYQDNTRYLSTGIGSVTIDFGASYQNYFGLLWGSVDKYNSLEFFKDGVSQGIVWGNNPFFTSQDGDQGVNGTFYVNVFAGPGVTFNSVVATSTQYAFEIDNVAFGFVSVPDSGATVALLGLSFACLFFFRRKAA